MFGMEDVKPLPGEVDESAYKHLRRKMYQLKEDIPCSQIDAIHAQMKNDFGRLFLALEAGFPVRTIVDRYLSYERDRHEVLGFAVAYKHQEVPDEDCDSVHDIFMNKDQWERKKESEKRDPTGVGFVNDISPATLRPKMQWFEIPRTSIPLSKENPEVKEYGDLNNALHKQYRMQYLQLLTVATTTLQSLHSSFWGHLRVKRIDAVEHAENALKKLIRKMDDFHVSVDEPVAWRNIGKYKNLPSLEFIEQNYKAFGETLKTIERKAKL